VKSPLEALREIRSAQGEGREGQPSVEKDRREPFLREGTLTQNPQNTQNPRPLGASRSPAADIEAAWRRAVARAREGFARAGREPAASDLEGAAALELAADPQAPVPEDARTQADARRFLPAVYEGRLVARVSAAGRPVVAQAVGVLDLRRRTPRPHPVEETRSRCAGCRERFPGAPGGLCGCCDLGVSALPPSRAMPFLLALREERGPAGRRGVRDGELRRWLKRERAERREVDSDQTDWLEEVEPQGSA